MRRCHGVLISVLTYPSVRVALLLGLIVGVLTVAVTDAGGSVAQATPVTTPLEDALNGLCWVAYAPTNWDPQPPGVEPTTDSIRADLKTLHMAGFRGLVTYGSTGILGTEVPQLAVEEGFEGLLLGLWDVPLNPAEVSAAQVAAMNPIVVGYVVGNEGLGERYDLTSLTVAVEEIRELTGKPVTTTEQIEDYSNSGVLSLGDWVFPNVHPYFHGRTDPRDAVAWTAWQYQFLINLTGSRPLLFKEVGLPTAGDPGVNEASQAEYYRFLRQTDTKFVYFEAFDQPWKRHLPVEPYWGLFRRDRSPKVAGTDACITH